MPSNRSPILKSTSDLTSEQIRAFYDDFNSPSRNLTVGRSARRITQLASLFAAMFVTSDYRFLGLAYEWHFEAQCWVIGNLASVTDIYRKEFTRTSFPALWILEGLREVKSPWSCRKYLQSPNMTNIILIHD
jgi:hypothetical protein